ncbi:hypothetical protein EVAR_33218_1 [Eumeta japonica]|uniref:Uncharacterized protein n=1 Tax=Eumeta variegata TaxID=151549 RepID=A0A4C1W245_EUMVA|nr:hypothetical protein EVAR_33218_1 [Eumeta japonica]
MGVVQIRLTKVNGIDSVERSKSSHRSIHSVGDPIPCSKEISPRRAHCGRLCEQKSATLDCARLFAAPAPAPRVKARRGRRPPPALGVGPVSALLGNLRPRRSSVTRALLAYECTAICKRQRETLRRLWPEMNIALHI